MQSRVCWYIRWSMVTNTNGPVFPSLYLTERIVEIFSAAVPICSGCVTCCEPDAHMRRGSGAGGRNPPFRRWPSTPVPEPLGVSRKYIQCHEGGKDSPIP